MKLLPVECRGIPHLAKNERNVGHPSLAVRRDFQEVSVYPCVETVGFQISSRPDTPVCWSGETSKEVSVYPCVETRRISDFVVTKYLGLLVRRDFEGGLCRSL